LGGADPPGAGDEVTPVKIKTVKYLGSFGDAGSFPSPQGPEIVFLGRSNVGKSSLINTLVGGRREIARTSNTPGKTRTANYYLVNDSFCFVDMPGYGYAQVSKTERGNWTRLIDRYIEEREVLKGVVLLLDVRHAPSRQDKEAAEKLKKSGQRCCLVFNKIDKIGKNAVDHKIASHLGGFPADPGSGVVAFSSETGQGRRELWAWVSESFESE
jgi:GTP-binding protein